MKVWELEEGKEYVSSSGNLYKILDGELMQRPSEDYGYTLSSNPYNNVIRYDFTEYAPPTDWSKVEVDTKVLCLCLDGVLVKRHFAKYENGRIYTWSYGTTQFTHDESYDESRGMTKWNLENVKFYTEE